MRKAVLVMISVLVLSFGAQRTAIAGSRYADKTHNRIHKAGFFDDSSLTQAQREKIAALREKFFRDTAELRAKFREAIFEYRQTRLLKPADQAALKVKSEKLEEARQALRKKAAEFHAELLKILTPEQQKKLRDSGFGQRFDGKARRRPGCR